MSIQQKIEECLTKEFMPDVLIVINESHQHATPAGAESHFKVVIVSQQFEKQGRVVRHQRIYQVLSDFLANGVHALALHIYTPQEWLACGESFPKTPSCVGHKK